MSRSRKLVRKDEKLKKERKAKLRASIPSEAEEARNEELLSKVSLRKPITRRGKRVLAERAPQVEEPPRVCVFLRSHTAKEIARKLLVDLHMLHKPYGVHFTTPQDVLNPFEKGLDDITRVAEKAAAAQFCYAVSSKSKPNRLVFGRLFDSRVLDLYDARITEYKGLKDFAKKPQPPFPATSLVIAQGAEFEESEELKYFRNYMLDFFAVGKPSRVLSSGLNVLVTLSATQEPRTDDPSVKDTVIHFRRYRMDQSGARAPFILARAASPSSSEPSSDGKGPVLDEIGPRFSVVLTKSTIPEKSMWKSAIKVPRVLIASKVKNVSKNAFGDVLGRIHVGVQELHKLSTPHHHSDTGIVSAKNNSLMVEGAGSDEEA